MRKFFISLRSYFANEYLKNMFLNDQKNFRKLIFSTGEDKVIKLKTAYEIMRTKVEKMLNENAKDKKVDITLPYDYNMKPVKESFLVSFARLASWEDKEGVIAFINLPKPLIKGEAWAVMAVYNYKQNTKSFYTLDYDGYKDENKDKDFLNAKFIVSEWVNEDSKVKIGSANNLAEVMGLLEEQNKLKDKSK